MASEACAAAAAGSEGASARKCVVRREIMRSIGSRAWSARGEGVRGRRDLRKWTNEEGQEYPAKGGRRCHSGARKAG
eukprot:scaffold16912_cov112-Isochrysis_galbana.AAC.3